MGIAILNIHNNKKEDKIPTIKLESPTTPHRCNIKVLKANYIDATKRVVAYCEKNGAAPAYVVSSSVEIGYAEYSFGFSKILAFYKTEKALPLYNQFDSSVFDDTSGEIIGVRIKKGINEKNTESNLNKYLDNYNDACRATDSIRAKAKQLTSGCTTTLQKARAIFNFVKNQISYKYYENSVYGASRTLANGRGNCCDKANLIVSLCRYSGIPARYSHGQHCHFYRSGHYYGHVWAQILVGKTWYAADATGSGNSLGFINNWNIDTFHTLRQYALIPF
jgi:transglutaminase-like putative cysteine protease